jgi:hypothetical protein
MGTLSFASRNTPGGNEACGNWLGCAKTLVAHGMPLPPPRYEYSEEVEQFFDGLSEGA